MTTAAAAPPTVSFVLAVQDGWDATFATLIALARASAGLRWETVVVDDGTADETSAALPHLPGLRWHRNERPHGLSAARNQGAALAQGARLIFLPAGAVPEPGWLDAPGASTGAARLACGAVAVEAAAFRAAGGFPDLPDLAAAEQALLARLADARPAGPPRFSVLVPTYNQAAFLPQAVASLMGQTCRDWEAVVVDDGSTDDTPQVLQALCAREPRLRAIRQRNGGVAAALNRALAEARGEWICWLSSDDLFLPEKLALHEEAIRQRPLCRFFHSGFLLLDELSRRLVEPEPPAASLIPEPALQVVAFLAQNYVNGISIAVHREVFAEVGTFDEALRQGQDYDLWLRITARHHSVYLDQPTCVSRVHPGQGSSVFRAANVLDSGRAALKFLEANPFQALFPRADLDVPDLARQALAAALRTAADPNAYLTASGFAPALLSRLAEWLTGRAPGPLTEALVRLHDEAVKTIWQGPSPAWVKAPFVPLAGWPAPHHHQPCDQLAVLAAHGQALRQGGYQAFAADVDRYLDRVRGQAEQAASRP